jgi:hypothetical protein
MASVTERQRARRRRLAENGLTEVSVTVPRGQTERVRTLAGMLTAGQPVAARLVAALKALRHACPELQARGVKRAGVFGSTARGEDRGDSDLDIVLRLGRERDVHPYRLMDLKDLVYAEVAEQLPDVDVDVVFYESLKPDVRAEVDRDVIYAD